MKTKNWFQKVVHSTLILSMVMGMVPVSSAQAADLNWVLGGYLPSNPNQKVYLKIQGRNIVDRLAAKPTSGTLLDTESLIFPGMVDLHNHMEDAFLGLWNEAKGDYLNRFEWRSKKEYELAVKTNEAAFDGDNEATCATLRWAELKAMVGGATSIQGSGSLGSCVSNFGINNVEIAGEYGNTQDIRANLEMVNPGNVSRVFLPMIKPYMAKGMTYDQALAQMMQDSGVTQWLTEFKANPRSLANGLKLAFGSDMGASQTTDLAAATKEFNSLLPAIQTRASTLKDTDGSLMYQSTAAVNSYLKALQIFILGDAKNKPYVGQKQADPAKEAAAALDYLGKGGNLRISGSVKRYLTMFEYGLKQGTLAALKSGKASAFITHLAEGMRNDVYNKEEYRLARDMGLLVPGVVLIHAVGMRVDPGVDPAKATAVQSDYVHANQNKISIVWSPFSNLLLYGETLDIAEARANQVNIAMGSDWSPTGSKNLLDELKIARRYIDQQLKRTDLTPRAKAALSSFNDQSLTEMVTLNAAKAMGVSSLIGKTDPGYQADLTLISKNALTRTNKADKTPYSALIYAEHEDVSLVVVKGQPLYGDTALIQSFAQAAKDPNAVESLPTNKKRYGTVCGFKKAIRFPFESPLDQHLTAGRNLRSVDAIEDLLVSKLAQNKNADAAHKASLDALYKCEESSETQYGQRFATFVESEVSADQSGRVNNRARLKLDDRFNPLKSSDDSDDN